MRRAPAISAQGYPRLHSIDRRKHAVAYVRVLIDLHVVVLALQQVELALDPEQRSLGRHQLRQVAQAN